MSESPTENPETKHRKSCTYRILTAIAIKETGWWFPAGVIADLSDLGDVRIRRLLEYRMIETADPSDEEPLFNQAVGTAKRKPCPCGK